MPATDKGISLPCAWPWKSAKTPTSKAPAATSASSPSFLVLFALPQDLAGEGAYPIAKVIAMSGGKELALELESKGYAWVHDAPAGAAAS